MPPRRLTPATLALLVIGFLLLRAFQFAITTNGEYALYHTYAVGVRNLSLAEFNRVNDVEYPPLAVYFGLVSLHVAEALPEGAEKLVALRPNPTRGPEGGERYEVGLGIVLFAVDVACIALVIMLVRRLYPDDTPLTRLTRIGVYVVATTAIGPILYDRQDLVVALVAMVALYAFARGWPLAAYTVLMLGTAYKIVPAFLLPLWVLAFAALRAAPAATPRRYLAAVVREAAIAGLILLVFPVLTYLLCGGERAFTFLTFHSARGLQLESSPAWLVLLLDRDSVVGYSYGSSTLRGPLADRVAAWTTPVTLLAMALSVLVTARRFWHAAFGPTPPDRNALVTHLATGSLLVWLGFILCTKVGSPQFLLWLGPLAALVPVRGRDRLWVVLLLAAMWAVTLVFPTFYRNVKGEMLDEDTLTWAGPDLLGYTLLAARSILLATAFVWLAVIVWRNNPAPTPPREAA